LVQALAAAGGLGILAAVVGLLLPPQHIATTVQDYAASPDVVWTAITDVDAYPTWRRGVERVERLPDVDGMPMWREHGSNGRLTMRVEEWDAPRRLLARIADEDLPYGGTWTWLIEPSGLGCRVTITEDGEIYNPLFRFVARFLMGYEATMTAYHEDLQAYLAEA